jgi:hypothetical protein
MRKNVIIDHVNYGPLVKVDIDGVTVVGEDWRFGLPCFKGKELTLESTETLYHPLRIELQVGNQPTFFAETQEEVVQVAKVLSQFHEVWVHAMARILATFKDGELVGEAKPLEYFYVLTDEEIEMHRLIGV